MPATHEERCQCCNKLWTIEDVTRLAEEKNAMVREVAALKMSVAGRDKAIELLNAGFKSACDDRDRMKQEIRKHAAGVIA
jgi:transposase-like protein